MHLGTAVNHAFSRVRLNCMYQIEDCLGRHDRHKLQQLCVFEKNIESSEGLQNFQTCLWTTCIGCSEYSVFVFLSIKQTSIKGLHVHCIIHKSIKVRPNTTRKSF